MKGKGYFNKKWWDNGEVNKYVVGGEMKWGEVN